MMQKRIILILQIAVVAVFLGRAWQHLFWDAPFRTLLWDEGIMKELIQGLTTMTWDEYITSPQMDILIQNIIKGYGWFYLLCAFFALMIKKWKKVSGYFMWFGSICLVFLAMLYCKERFFSIGQFFEYALQFSAPILLYYAVNQKSFSKRNLFYIKLAIALTFVCHGLYAIGFYPRPGMFTEMTMLILGLSEDASIQFLNFAATMDFVIGIGIFLPFKFSKWVILYAALWGFMTTISRTWAYVEFDYFLESAHQWVFESVYRIPHFLIPLMLYFYLKNLNYPPGVNFYKT